MNEFIEKLIGRLEETDLNDIQMVVREVLKKYGFPYESIVQDEVWDALDELSANKFAISIVNQLAEEYMTCYKSCTECEAYDKEKHYCPKWCDVIKHTTEELAEEYNNQNTDQDLMIVESLPSLYPMMQPFEVEAIHRVVSSAKHSGGWISCSTDMPDHDEEVFIKFSDGAICNGRFWIAEGANYCGFNTKFGLFVAEQVMEWKPFVSE